MDTAEALNQQAIAAYGAGSPKEAVRLWQQASALTPERVDILTYLGSALKGLDEPGAAAAHYEQALQLQPEQPQVLYNLGNIRQQLGQLQEAALCYRNVLKLEPGFALAAYNLGNVCRDLGHLHEAGECYRHAIQCDPNHAASHNNLGNTLKHAGKLDEAIACYEQALRCHGDYPDALYNLGNALYESEDYAAAISWFDRAGIRDAAARALYCEYRCARFEDFRKRLQHQLSSAPHLSPQIATLVAHHAINFGTKNTYRFCPQPFDFVYHESLAELSGEDSALRADLLEDITTAHIDERTQGRLHHGVQSAGNLLNRDELSFARLAQLVRHHLRAYQTRFAGADCELLRAFPQALDFESSWYIRMQQGGHLTSHIHESGWVSGVLYLALPDPSAQANEGHLELGVHGDSYPQVESAGEWPTQVVPIAVGDIVLFPANLFHRTLPFSSKQQRICIAFDLKPAAGPV